MKREKKLKSAVAMAFFLFGLCSAAPGQLIPATPPPVIDEVTDEVRWNAWSDDVFKNAGIDGKPVLLSIEARWQYESQTLRLDLYQDKAFAARVNTAFVPVRVDADQRPDLVRRYAPEGVPAVLLLSPAGLSLRDPQSALPYSGLAANAALLRQQCEAVAERLSRGGSLQELLSPAPEAEPLHTAEMNVFGDDYVRSILKAIDSRYDPEEGGFGDPNKFYQPKTPGVDPLRLHLLAAQLWKDPALLSPVSVTLEKMFRGRNFYQEGFGEVAEYRNWVRSNTEKTLGTNMALLELYLRMHRETGENRFMEPAYRIMEDTVRFQDMFLRRGFGGSFYSAQRALVRTDYERGLAEGPMVQSLIMPWDCQAIRAYYLLTGMTQEPKWARLAGKALDFMRTEMVHASGRAAYSLDRTGPGEDTLFAAHPALALTLLEAFQRTANRELLDQAAALMKTANESFWLPEPGYYSDVLPNPAAIGLLKQPFVDLDANGLAAEVLIQLALLNGDKEDLSRARQVLLALAGEAEKHPEQAAEFCIAVLKYLHPPVHAVVVGALAHSRTIALRDAALGLNAPHLVVETVEPEKSPARLEQLKLKASENPELYFCLDAHRLGPAGDPEAIEKAYRDLMQKMEKQ